MVTFFQTVQSFVQFLLNWMMKGGKLVDQNTANLRASICAGCHNNQPTAEVRKTSCSSCGKAGSFLIRQLRQKIIGKNTTTSDSRLLACALCGCELKIKVWIPNSALGEEKDVNAFPTFCWRKKFSEGLDV